MKQHQYEKLTNFIKKPKAMKWILFGEKHPEPHQVINLKVGSPQYGKLTFKEVVLQKEGFRYVKDGHLVPYQRLETIGYEMLEWKPILKGAK